MMNNTVIPLNKPEEIAPLQEILKEGARKLLASAVKAELHFLAEHNSVRTTVLTHGDH